jgi:hypothetical protein
LSALPGGSRPPRRRHRHPGRADPHGAPYPRPHQGLHDLDDRPHGGRPQLPGGHRLQHDDQPRRPSRGQPALPGHRRRLRADVPHPGGTAGRGLPGRARLALRRVRESAAASGGGAAKPLRRSRRLPPGRRGAPGRFEEQLAREKAEAAVTPPAAGRVLMDVPSPADRRAATCCICTAGSSRSRDRRP